MRKLLYALLDAGEKACAARKRKKLAEAYKKKNSAMMRKILLNIKGDDNE